MDDKIIISCNKARKWGLEILTKGGLSSKEANDVLDVLIHSNLRGVDTHGIIKIVHYTKRLLGTSRKPVQIINESGTICLVDGGDNLGPIVAKYAMEKAMEKARIQGSGVAIVRNSNHYGTAAYYSLMAAQQGMLGISMTNASRRVAPWGGIDAIVGNNPWSVAIPGDEFPIVLDMANTVVANGKIRECKLEGKPLPEGWAMDSDGNPTKDPDKALKGTLMPIGGYKGVGISVMVDLICGALSQNGFSKSIARLEDSKNPQKVGHFFMAINIFDIVDPNVFRNSIADYIKMFKGVRLKTGCNEVYLPGEIEWRLEQERKEKGFPLTRSAIEKLNVLAKEMGVQPFYQE